MKLYKERNTGAHMITLCQYCHKQPQHIGNKTGRQYRGCYDCEKKHRDNLLKEIGVLE